MIYLLHDDELYYYVRFGEGNNDISELELLDKVKNKQLYTINDDKFMYLREVDDKGQKT